MEKTSVKTISSVVLLLVVIGAGYYLNNKQNKLTSITLQPQTAGRWESYTSPDGTFNFKYPNDWYLSKEEKNIMGMATYYSWNVSNFTSTNYNYLKPQDGQIQAQFAIMCNPKSPGKRNEDIRDDCALYTSYSNTIECGKINIQGQQYTKSLNTYNNEQTDGKDFFTFFIKTNKGQCYYEMLSHIADGQNRQSSIDMLNRISETFQIK